MRTLAQRRRRVNARWGLCATLLLAAILWAAPARANVDFQVDAASAGPAAACDPIAGESYGTLSIVGSPTDRPAEVHADLNLALRSYEVTSAPLFLVEYGPTDDPRAPQLRDFFWSRRLPSFSRAYQVYDWDWPTNSRGSLITDWDVTMGGMPAVAGETLHVPGSGYDIGQGYEVMVLYAAENRITLKYTREDNVVVGYTLHVEGICVEPNLLALYRSMNNGGRGQLPALRARQAFGRAVGGEVGVAIRDSGAFMDPRSRNDWWIGVPNPRRVFVPLGLRNSALLLARQDVDSDQREP
jgi:hypothetical protein